MSIVDGTVSGLLGGVSELPSQYIAITVTFLARVEGSLGPYLIK
jgi:hypothetical protein